MILRAIPTKSPKAGLGWRWWRSASVRPLPSFEDFPRDPAFACLLRDS